MSSHKLPFGTISIGYHLLPIHDSIIHTFCRQVLLQGHWYPCCASLDGDSLCLTLDDLDDVDDISPDDAVIRSVTVTKAADQGLGVSVKGGSENGMPIIISKIFQVGRDSRRTMFFICIA